MRCSARWTQHGSLSRNGVCQDGRRPSTTLMTPAGLEPAIPGSVGRCLIHWATGPLTKVMDVSTSGKGADGWWSLVSTRPADTEHAKRSSGFAHGHVVVLPRDDSALPPVGCEAVSVWSWAELAERKALNLVVSAGRAQPCAVVGSVWARRHRPRRISDPSGRNPMALCLQRVPTQGQTCCGTQPSTDFNCFHSSVG